MRDLSEGFELGDRRFPWGTTLPAVAAAFGPPSGALLAQGYGRVRLPCARAFGFAAAGAELIGPGPQGQVLEIIYHLAPPADGQLPDPADWAGQLAAGFGPPAKTSHYTVAPPGPPENQVRCNAHWTLGDHAIRLTLFGGLREEAGGLAAGHLGLHWSIEAAARPFRKAWLARGAELAQAPSALQRIQLRTPQQPRFTAATWGNPGWDEAQNILYAPQVLRTPEAIAATLAPDAIALYHVADGRRWCASTPWDSVMMAVGEAVAVQWAEIQPGRGGGFCELRIGGLAAA